MQLERSSLRIFFPLQRAHSLASSWLHLPMKLSHAKCHERAILRRLWRQTGSSSLLSHAKCWLVLHVIRACRWRWPDVVAGIWARFSKFAFVLFYNKLLNDWSRGQQWILFPENLNVCLEEVEEINIGIRDRQLRVTFHLLEACIVFL